MSGHLTTHVLDTAKGLPAAGLTVELFRIDDAVRLLLATVTTNADGRTDGPILPAAQFLPGTYELVFHVGDYLDRAHGSSAGPRFLDLVPVRFVIGDGAAHYHVPLLLAPFGYATYRGS